jgi:hypothetical protein
LFFSFVFSPLHLFTTNVIRALSLETIKEEAQDTSRGGQGFTMTDQNRLLSKTKNRTHTSPEETWDPLPLSKGCNPYYEHSGARQYEQQ